ncbi:hypothetical protein MLD38_024454 [Melastoma candidum]|uniref:Uncharacterized protein n=1 Tax=Melastoma candidum TaxID=119954 RepID=A0ACB9NVC3_9MYRT|nr:hypothetical protein MLD38_024454 [Melastoma candidum]
MNSARDSVEACGYLFPRSRRILFTPIFAFPELSCTAETFLQRKRRSISYIVICVMVLMLLPLFYVFIYLYQSGIRRGTQDLWRISLERRSPREFTENHTRQHMHFISFL